MREVVNIWFSPDENNNVYFFTTTGLLSGWLYDGMKEEGYAPKA